MTISSQRFKFLDRETNVGTIDFTSLTDNAVYTAAVDSADSAIKALKEGEGLLSEMGESLSDLMDKVNSAKDSVMRKISDALNAAIDKILSMKLPKFVTDILDSLKALDLGGVKSFLKDLLKVGSIFLCNNLDFLKSFMLGYSLTENILSGLLIGLLLSWLDRYCKGFTDAEVQAASLKGKLDMMFTSSGFGLTSDTALGHFSNSYSDLVRSNTSYIPSNVLSNAELLDLIKSGNKEHATSNIRASEISSQERKEILAAIATELESHEPGSPEYSNLLDGRGDITKLPLISSDRIDNANSFSNLNDALGNLALNVKDVDLTTISDYNLSEVEKSLLNKLKDFKASVESDSDINTRDQKAGAFDDYNFSTLLPEPSQADKDYLATLPGIDDSHRYNGLHPTTEIFLESTMPGNTTYKPDEVPPSGGTDYVSGSPDGSNSNGMSPTYNPDRVNPIYVDGSGASEPMIPGCCHA